MEKGFGMSQYDFLLQGKNFYDIGIPFAMRSAK